jgi:hypothetical protein
MENNNLLNIIIQKEEEWLEISAGKKKYRQDIITCNDPTPHSLIYKEESIPVFINPKYDFGYSIFFNILLIWDSEYDIDLFTCANIIRNKSERFHIHSLYKNKDNLYIVFKDDIPSLYSVGNKFKVRNRNLNIKETLSLNGGLHFLYPNYGSFKERIDNGYRYSSSLENPFIEKLFYITR